jgi:hypothetical protein
MVMGGVFGSGSDKGPGTVQRLTGGTADENS